MLLPTSTQSEKKERAEGREGGGKGSVSREGMEYHSCCWLQWRLKGRAESLLQLQQMEAER